MSTDTLEATSVPATVTDYGPPPAGMRWKRSKKDGVTSIVLDTAGKPVAVPKTKKSKKSKAAYSVPDGGLTTHETPGFVIGEMRKLVLQNFQDPLNYAKWNQWYCEEMLNRAKKEVENMQALGATVEERKANVEASKAMASIENFISKQKSTGKPSSALQERLAKLLAEISVG